MSSASSRSLLANGTCRRSTLEGALQGLRSLQWRAQVDPLAGGEELDRHDVEGIGRHGEQAACAVGRHAHVILLVGRGRDAVHARRMTQHAILRHECRGGDLRHHEAGIDPALRGEEGRQAAHLRIDQQRHAALGDGTDLRAREREDIGREGHRLGVKVAPGEDLAGVGKHQRVVGDGVGLDDERRGLLRHQIQTGTHDLRLAAQRVGVLHARAGAVRFADLAPLKQRPIAAARRGPGRRGRARGECADQRAHRSPAAHRWRACR